jgi:transposase
MSRVEIMSGPERRRRWSEDQKRAIVAEAFAAGASVSEVARRADVVPGQIYRWRHELGTAAKGFAAVMVAPSPGERSGLDTPTIEIDFGGDIRVRIPAATPGELASAVIKALVAR